MQRWLFYFFSNTSWGLSQPAVVGLLDPRHVMIHLSSHEDMVKAWTRESHIIDSSLFRLFRWSPDFHPRYESSLSAVWIRLPYLPLPFLSPAYLKGLVGTFGRFLRADERTLALAHPMFARVCVEMDVSQPLPSRVWVGPSKEEWILPVAKRISND